jgi:hypothetical protein
VHPTRMLRLGVVIWKQMRCQLHAYYIFIIRMIKARFIYTVNAASTEERAHAYKSTVHLKKDHLDKPILNTILK